MRKWVRGLIFRYFEICPFTILAMRLGLKSVKNTFPRQFIDAEGNVFVKTPYGFSLQKREDATFQLREMRLEYSYLLCEKKKMEKGLSEKVVQKQEEINALTEALEKEKKRSTSFQDDLEKARKSAQNTPAEVVSQKMLYYKNQSASLHLALTKLQQSHNDNLGRKKISRIMKILKDIHLSAEEQNKEILSYLKK